MHPGFKGHQDKIVSILEKTGNGSGRRETNYIYSNSKPEGK